jgi:3-phosphoshikimate 1-carboxyvinyltransferase
MKESDRLSSVTAALSALGGCVEEGPDFLNIQGKEALAGGVTVDSFNDHRIAMMAAIAATRCEKPVTITGAECVAKSYPNFWEEYARLGGKLKRGL